MPYADNTTVISRSTLFIVRASSDQFIAGHEFADSEIDSALANSRFASLLPFDLVPREIKSIAADLAAAFIIIDLYQNGVADAPVSYAEFLANRAERKLLAMAGVPPGLPETNVDGELPSSSVAYTQGIPGPLAGWDGRSIPNHPLFGGRRGRC